MTETPTGNGESLHEDLDILKQEMMSLGLELSESAESIPFPGINVDSLSTIKAEQEQLPDHAGTPIEKLIKRMEEEGIKISLGPNPDSGNIFVLPFNSEDIKNDSIFPRHLDERHSTNNKLQRLIALHSKLK